MKGYIVTNQDSVYFGFVCCAGNAYSCSYGDIFRFYKTLTNTSFKKTIKGDNRFYIVEADGDITTGLNEYELYSSSIRIIKQLTKKEIRSIVKEELTDYIVNSDTRSSTTVDFFKLYNMDRVYALQSLALYRAGVINNDVFSSSLFLLDLFKYKKTLTPDEIVLSRASWLNMKKFRMAVKSKLFKTKWCFVFSYKSFDKDIKNEKDFRFVYNALISTDTFVKLSEFDKKVFLYYSMRTHEHCPFDIYYDIKRMYSK